LSDADLHVERLAAAAARIKLFARLTSLAALIDGARVVHLQLVAALDLFCVITGGGAFVYVHRELVGARDGG